MTTPYLAANIVMNEPGNHVGRRLLYKMYRDCDSYGIAIIKGGEISCQYGEGEFKDFYGAFRKVQGKDSFVMAYLAKYVMTEETGFFPLVVNDTAIAFSKNPYRNNGSVKDLMEEIRLLGPFLDNQAFIYLLDKYVGYACMAAISKDMKYSKLGGQDDWEEKGKAHYTKVTECKFTSDHRHDPVVVSKDDTKTYTDRRDDGAALDYPTQHQKLLPPAFGVPLKPYGEDALPKHYRDMRVAEEYCNGCHAPIRGFDSGSWEKHGLCLNCVATRNFYGQTLPTNYRVH